MKCKMLLKTDLPHQRGATGLPEVSSPVSNPELGPARYSRRQRYLLMAQRIITLGSCCFAAFGHCRPVPDALAVRTLFLLTRRSLIFSRINTILIGPGKSKMVTIFTMKQIADVRRCERYRPSLPAGEWHEDEFTVESEFTASPIRAGHADHRAAGATLTVTYQGCADAGFCYPPETKSVPLGNALALRQRRYG